MLHIGRQHRAELYNLQPQPKAPLIPAARCFGVDERLDAPQAIPSSRSPAPKPNALHPPSAASGVESAAICLLFSFRNLTHESMLAAALEERGIHVSPSHRGASRTPGIRTRFHDGDQRLRIAAHAAVFAAPGAKRRRARRQTLRIMQSNGGSISAAQAGSEAVHTVLSGPAGGVVGAAGSRYACRFQPRHHLRYGRHFDRRMLGARTSASNHRGRNRRSARPCADFPIHTVGAGGGSIAYLDAGGALRVGPRSAGANPGPACYGLGGTQPTVTDAHVVLNRLPAEGFLGGRLRLDARPARRARRATGQHSRRRDR